MEMSSIVAAIDSEIVRLQQARALLAQSNGSGLSVAKRSAPAKSAVANEP